MPRSKILVVDDDPDIREYLDLILSPHFDLLFARDGREGWAMVQVHKPRLVLSDLNMPGLNGQQLTERIKTNEALADTPVIILTGTTRDSDLPPGFWKMGTKADSLLEKPCTGESIIQEIRRLLVLRSVPEPLAPGSGSYEKPENKTEEGTPK